MKKTNKAEKNISIRLNSDDEEILNKLVEKTGLTKSNVIRELINSAEESTPNASSGIPIPIAQHLSNIVKIGMSPLGKDSVCQIMEEIREICIISNL